MHCNTYSTKQTKTKTDQRTTQLKKQNKAQIQHNTTQHNTTKYNTRQQNIIQHKLIQHNIKEYNQYNKIQ